MKPAGEDLKRLCPELDERLLRAHAERMDAAYFQRFPLPVIREHLRALVKITPQNPVEILLPASDKKVEQLCHHRLTVQSYIRLHNRQTMH